MQLEGDMHYLPHDEENYLDVSAIFYLAHEAEQFFKTELGQRMALAAYEESQAAKDALVTVNPSDTKAIAALQVKAVAAVRWIQWFNEKISEARLSRDEEIQDIQD